MRRSYVVEILFTLVLFTIFVVGSFFILLKGADVYKTQVTTTSQTEQWRLPLSYINTKIKQADSNNIYVTKIDNIDCLVIEEKIDDKTYVDMIYHLDGYLYENYLLKDIMSINNGNKICELDIFKINKEDNKLSISVDNDKTLNIVLR